LPADIIGFIASYGSIRDNMLSLAVVNRDMQQLIRQSSYIQRIRCIQITPVSFDSLVRRSTMVNCHKTIVHNDYSRFATLLQSLIRLERLTFTGCQQVDDQTLKAVARNAPSTLRELSIDWCNNVSDQGLSSIARACPKLTSLTLFRGSTNTIAASLTDASLSALMRHCPHLEQVLLAYTELTRKGIQNFVDASNLRIKRIVQSQASRAWGPTSIHLEIAL
jgi:hypothetical protein